MNINILTEVSRQFTETSPNSNIIRIYALLDFTVTFSENVVDIESEYFGSLIEIKITTSEGRNDGFHCLITITDENGMIEMYKSLNHKVTHNLIYKVVQLINTYVKSRPFIIIHYSRGQHKLLDPNGMDYIGQYVTLKDAKKTSFNNYLK
jgi:hypothetical protein